MKLKIAAMLAPFVVALVVVLVFFLPQGDTVKAFEIWVPEDGEIGDLLQIEIPMDQVEIIGGVPMRSGTLDAIHEVSLEEFKSHNYQDVLYGTWASTSSDPYVFYWTTDPEYPRAGVWTRIYLDPGFGRVRGFLDRDYYAAEYPEWEWPVAYDAKANPWGNFQGDVLYIALERDLDYGKTPIPAIRPAAFYTIIVLAASLTSLALLLIPFQRIRRNRT